MASRWNGEIKKLKPWVSKGQSNRTSFIPPKSTEPETDALEFVEGKDNIPNINHVNSGNTRQFEPNEEYNFKSAWKRYEKALEIRPSKISKEEGKTTYFYYSSNANTGFWEVTISEESGTFINLLIRSYIIICPPQAGFKLVGTIESDGRQFKWEQRAGNRTVLFDDDTIKEPTIFIQSTCYTTGCDSGTGLPIVLRVSLANNPDIYQDLIVYNTLTSTHFGVSVSKGIVSDRECQKVSIIPYISLPVYLQNAYCEDVNSIFVTWNPPSCESEFIVGYSLTRNTTGSYVVIDYASVNEERLFELELNKHYKIISHFNFYGKLVDTPSNVFYFISTDVTHKLYGDDSFSGISSSKQSQNIITVDLKVSTYQYEDIYTGISSSKQSQAISQIELKSSSYIYVDEYVGIGASKMTSSYTKVNLGGVVIG